MIWVKCRTQYGTTATPEEFMSLYKKSVYTHFCDLSNRDTELRSMTADCVLQPDVAVSYEAEMHLQLKLSGLSGEVREVLHVLFSAPDEVMSALREVAAKKPISMLKQISKYCGFTDGRTKEICNELRAGLK